MIELYAQSISVMEGAFQILASQVPQPRLISTERGRVFRYDKPSTEIALILRAARLISGLNASLLLIINGYTQEAYCVFRTLDEFNEDINFLVIPIVTGSESDDHKRFIDYMFREERWVGGVDCFVEKKRPSIPREKIQKAIAKSAAHLADPADTKKSHTTLQAAFSGFVHGAANHILDLYGGNPPRFHVKGTCGTPRDAESVECAGNYFYRSLLSMMLISTALGNESVHRTLFDFLKYFESRTDVV